MTEEEESRHLQHPQEKFLKNNTFSSVVFLVVYN